VSIKRIFYLRKGSGLWKIRQKYSQVVDTPEPKWLWKQKGLCLGYKDRYDKGNSKERIMHGILNTTENKKSKALESIIKNVKRLLNDAEILLEHGSMGSSLSLAILAFEEAGKGHIIEFSYKKPKGVKIHPFRHQIAHLVIVMSFIQKYELHGTDIKDIILSYFANLPEDALSKLNPLSMPETLRNDIRKSLQPSFSQMDLTSQIILKFESIWLKSITEDVGKEKVEALRQSGLYCDINETYTVTSSPLNVQKAQAARWIWAAHTALNLLENGMYYQPYGPLATYIESLIEQGESVEGIFKKLSDLYKK
jgi:hypothetical protein